MTATIKRTARRWGVLLSAAALLIAGFFLGIRAAPSRWRPNSRSRARSFPRTGGGPWRSPPTGRRLRLWQCTDNPRRIRRLSHFALRRRTARPYVNKRIIEMAAAKANVDVTPIEIEAAIDDDCKRLKSPNRITKRE